MNATPDTRQCLVDAARDLISARSYHAVGVQEICGQAGVRKGSFYHFFDTKRDLALAALDDMANHFSHNVFAQAFDDDIAPLARIERFFDAVYAYHRQVQAATGHVQGCPFGNLAGELGSQEETVREKVDGIFSMVEVAIDKTLQDAIQAGDLAPVDTAAAARAIFAYTEGLILYAKTRNDAEIIRDLGRRALLLATATGREE